MAILFCRSSYMKQPDCYISILFLKMPGMNANVFSDFNLAQGGSKNARGVLAYTLLLDDTENM